MLRIVSVSYRGRLSHWRSPISVGYGCGAARRADCARTRYLVLRAVRLCALRIGGGNDCSAGYSMLLVFARGIRRLWAFDA